MPTPPASSEHELSRERSIFAKGYVISLHTGIHIRIFLFLTMGAIALVHTRAHAQNMGTVFSPVVEEGSSDVVYRIGYQPEGNAMAQRLVYQYGVTNQWQLRGMVQFYQNDAASLGFQYVRLEAMWQFLEEEVAGWASALRFSLQIPDNSNTPYRVGLAWSGLVNFDEDWQLRANFLIKREFGADSESGFFPGGRVQVSRKLTPMLTLALDFFAGFNNVTDLGDFDANTHQVGPLLGVRISEHLNMEARALFGISSTSPSVSYLLNIAYAF